MSDTNTNTMTDLMAALQAERDALRAENLALKGQKGIGNGNIVFKVSEKGAVSVYGLQRFPITLFREQWSRLMGVSEELQAFIEAHDEQLVLKGEVKLQNGSVVKADSPEGSAEIERRKAEKAQTAPTAPKGAMTIRKAQTTA